MSCTAEQFVNEAQKFVGYNEFDGSYLSILDIYNSHKPLARGYKMRPGDSWCDCFVSAIAIKTNSVDIIGTEVSCERHRAIFENKGVWRHDNTITPKKGDIVIYTWDSYTSPVNYGYPCHIGIVEKAKDRLVTTIEGNFRDAVGRREYAVGWGYVLGYARPKFAAVANAKQEQKRKIALAVIRGDYGNGQQRIDNLKKAGYDPVEIQQLVNDILRGN